jgi:predicted ATP-grasp superfamily ATP-dependent carboligase
MRVLILGARAPACLQWARVFKATGAQVFAADTLAFPLVRFSRSIEQYFQLPSAYGDTGAWLNALTQIIKERSIDVLLPTCEEVFYVAHCLPQLTQLCRVPVVDFDLIHRLHHKGMFAELAQNFAVRSPETHLLNDADGLAAFASQANDWVFKPAYSRFAVNTLIRPPGSQLLKIQPTKAQPWVAQRFIAGQEFCSYSVLVDGQLTAHVCYQPRYRVGQGAGIYMQPAAENAIHDFVREFGHATKFTGQVGFDFMKDASGQCHALECNPRATSGVHFLAGAAEQLVHALLGTDNFPEIAPSNKPHMVGLAMLLFAAPRNLFSKLFWQDFKRAQDVIIQSPDYKPFLSQPLSLIELAWIAVKNQQALLDATTDGIAWNGQKMQHILHQDAQQVI